MKPKSIIIGTVVLCAGLGVYFFVKSRGAASAPGDEGNTPTIISVQTGTLQRMTLHRYIAGYGTVAPAPATADNAAADAPLAAPSAGVVAQVNVAEGQQVMKGDVLMTLNSSTATLKSAEQELARQKELYAEHNTSLKALQNAEAQLAALQVVAPLSGTVVAVNVKPGAAVDVTTVVAEVMNLNRLVVRTDVPESEANQLQPGEPLRVLTKPPVDTTVSFVNPTVDSNNATVRAWAELPADCGLRPGQFVPLQIVTAVHTNCLAVPAASVVTDESGHSSIWLVQGDEATQTPVQTGFRENGWVEVEEKGLKEGDSVVTVGAYGLPDKTQIKVANSSADETSATNSASAQAQ